MTDVNFLWSDEEICDYFDTHPNVLISELAQMSGHTTSYVKYVLMKEETNND